MQLKNMLRQGFRMGRDRGTCFCGKKAIGGIGIPLIQLTESHKVVNLEENQSSIISPICPYHSVFAEKGFLKTDGKQTLIPEPLLRFEVHTNKCLIKKLRDGKGKKGIKFDRFVIEIILQARHTEKMYPEFLEKMKGKDILESMKLMKKMFKVPNLK